MNEPNYIVVVGASAGGVNSVIELAAQLDKNLNLSIFVVLHLNHSMMMNHLIARVQNNTSLVCKVGEHNESIRSGHLYLAAPEKHLLLKEGKIVLGDGPAENRWRPSIDVLFRSAAAAYDSKVIGIILTGLMQDGTSGMLAIQRCGGITIVQDPEQAEYPDMPMSVLDRVKVDYCTRLENMGTIIREKSNNKASKAKYPIPEDIKAEAALAERAAVSLDTVKQLGAYGEVSCPDCGGGLWEMKGEKFKRFRCHTGHVYTADELLLKQHEALENTLWVALRMMEERRNLLKKMAEEEMNKGWIKSASSKAQRQVELDMHIDRLKSLLFEAKES